MKKQIELEVELFRTEVLPAGDRKLYDAAIRAATRAYAPYSHFHVGAAVLLSNGTIVEGNNQENVSYPSGLCAERVALFSAGASFPDIPVVSLAIAAIKDGIIQPSVSPCGGCRQVMLETEQRSGHPMRILLCGSEETIILPSSQCLLPFSFASF